MSPIREVRDERTYYHYCAKWIRSASSTVVRKRIWTKGFIAPTINQRLFSKEEERTINPGVAYRLLGDVGFQKFVLSVNKSVIIVNAIIQ